MALLTIAGHALEYLWIEGTRPTMVFLHEGLGSVELWRTFPAELAASTGNSALVYSRLGHGWSDPLSGPRPLDFMEREALETLPALLDALEVDDPVLVGHSDGASIALIHAGAGPRPASALIALAPHVFVEPETLAGTDAALSAFRDNDMAQKMARYHRDPVATFDGWVDVWQDPAFRDWNIETVLPGIDCPALVIQGADDEYGPAAQLDAIESGIPGTLERLWLADCGHSPHLDQPHQVVAAATDFIQRAVTA